MLYSVFSYLVFFSLVTFALIIVSKLFQVLNHKFSSVRPFFFLGIYFQDLPFKDPSEYSSTELYLGDGPSVLCPPQERWLPSRELYGGKGAWDLHAGFSFHKGRPLSQGYHRFQRTRPLFASKVFLSGTWDTWRGEATVLLGCTQISLLPARTAESAQGWLRGAPQPCPVGPCTPASTSHHE